MAVRRRVANIYSGNQTPWAVSKWLVNDGIQIALLSEIDRQHLEPLRSVGRLATRLGATRPEDTGILIRGRRRRRRAEVKVRKVSPFIPRPGSDKPMLWRDRDIVRVIDHKAKTVDYSVHNNAAIGNLETGKWWDNKGAFASKDAMKWLHDDAAKWIELGYDVFIGGDFNLTGNKDVPWNPAWVFKDLDMNWVSDGRVMFFAWTENPKYTVEANVTERAPGADAHRSITATRKRKSRFRRGA